MRHRWELLERGQYIEGIGYRAKWELTIVLDSPLDLGDMEIIAQKFLILGENHRNPPIPDDKIEKWFNRWAYRRSCESIRQGMVGNEYRHQFDYHPGGSD